MMHALTEWFTRNQVAANLIMAFILIAGWFSARSIRIEGFPAIPVNSVTVSTICTDVKAEEVDQSVSRKIEKSLEGMPGLKKVMSSSIDGLSMVTVQKTSGYSIDRFQNDIRTRVDGIYSLPKTAERPVVARDELTIEALLVQVYGDVDDTTLQKTGAHVKKVLSDQPEIAKIEEFGILSPEIRIEVSEERLVSLGLTLEDIASFINQSSLDMKAGRLVDKNGEILIHTEGKACHYNDFISIPVIAANDGKNVRLGDIATIIDGYEDADIWARFQGKTSIGLQVYTTKKGNVLEVSRAAHEAVKKIRKELPEGIQVDIWGESAGYMQDRLNLLQTNAWQGLLIVFMLLALFLNARLAFWVAMGIPISIAGTFVVMGERFLDYSLNDITTFGMIIVLGILVDDAVVVGESIFEERAKESDPVQGTVNGVSKVSKATIFGCLTTVAAFYPLQMIDNELGKILAGFSVVVIIALLISLFESKFILPAHLVSVDMAKKSSKNRFVQLWEKLQQKADSMLTSVNFNIYQPVLKTAISHIYTVLVIFISIAVLTAGLIFKGKVRTVFFPEVPGQIISVNLEMKTGAPLYQTIENLERIEKMAKSVNAEFMEKLNLTEPPIAKLMTFMESRNKVSFFAELQPEDKRRVDTMTVLNRWRELTGTVEGAEKLSFSGSFETGGGFIVNLSAKDDAVLKNASGEFVNRLLEMENVFEVYENLSSGSKQLTLTLKPDAKHLGITEADLISHIANAYGGLEVKRFQRGADEVKVIVALEKKKRKYIEQLMRSQIRTGSGQLVSLEQAAEFTTCGSAGMVYRENGLRTISVRAKLNKEKLSASEAWRRISTKIEPALTAKYPGLSINGVGEIEETGEMKSKLKHAMILICLLIYVLLAIPLKSYFQPIVILSVVPFGFTGAVIGHLITGHPLSVLSFFGMLAVMGITVNDSLVMMTRYNSLVEEGVEVKTALIQAGGSRFRAIFLTTVTTFAGLMPLIFETSEQAQYLIPAAVSLAFGELFATLITLVIVPLMIAAGDDLKSLLNWLFFATSKHAEERYK